MIKKESNNKLRIKRHFKIRNRISGTKEVPRLSVFRSNKEIYAQLIDDVNGVTLASASSLKLKDGQNVDGAKQVGLEIGKVAKDLKIKSVVFDRSGYKYHGRVKSLAEGAREAGLEF